MDPTTTSASSADDAALLITQRFIDRTVIVHIPDGRAFRGTLLCIDNGVNIILNNTYEVHRAPLPRGDHPAAANGAPHPAPTYTERNVGMVMVPGAHVVRFEVEHETMGAGSRLLGSGPFPTSSMAQAGWPDDPDMYG
ncbi:uncharacterized protein PFL1_02177 [Pseudozyma flocculosa PF-1]|uniref:Sm domain-containing protein n=1 Tax=Pseudozyma flocculosa TaxID=84751 RepID=A0A5C3FD65_9BASI|nr:uncharacterized protein PFL1_02177 [Pseudozyma flocculosa PF-1]EPQ30060.1 hypothetical protein PFL1_02177 [Pseudozyma flocculosa PF-1]SPO41401.1 uncharacterized protein PSFLO_06883 [Pseudozyma flocculosa]